MAGSKGRHGHRRKQQEALHLRENVSKSLDLLSENRTATSVVVEFFKAISESDCLMLFASLSAYSTMTTLRVTNLMVDNKVPIKALTALVKNPSCRLRHLHLDLVELTGSVNEYIDLVESFRLCCLQSVRLDDCEYEDETISLDPFVRALSTIPTLERVSLTRTRLAPVGTAWNCQCLLPLLPQIRSLTLKGMPDFQHDTICLLALALENRSCALKELKIQKQKLSVESMDRMGRMLRRNRSLQEVTLGVKSHRQVTAIAKQLAKKQSRSLRTLNFPGEWGQQEGDGYMSDLRRSMLEMVQTQTQLYRLSLGDDTCQLSQELRRYIHMNMQNEQSLEAFEREQKESDGKIMSTCIQHLRWGPTTSAITDLTMDTSERSSYSALLNSLMKPNKRVRFQLRAT